MSATELSSMLADPALGGAYFVDAHDRSALLDAGVALNFAIASVDCHSVRDRDDALARIALALDFPDWFGGNWDALQDSLCDLSWLPGDGYLLLLDHSSGWREADPESFSTLIEILNEAGQHWAAQRQPFWALMPLTSNKMATIES